MISLLSTWSLILEGTLLITLLYFYLSNKYRYWSEQGVVTPKPLPLIGSVWSRLSSSPKLLEVEWLRKYGRVYGLYEGVSPVLLVADHELIKQILVKDFSSFVNRRKQKFYHEIVSRSLFDSESDDWKRIRSIVTPSFTTGKLRGMHGLMARCIDKLDRDLSRVTGQEVNVRQMMSHFTINVIASTAFATEITDEDAAQNTFVLNGSRLFNVSIPKFAAIVFLPSRVLTWLGIKTFFSQRPLNFFIDLCRKIVFNRRKHDVKQRDLVQMLIDAYVYENDLKDSDYDKLTAVSDNVEIYKNENLAGKERKTLSEDEIVAQCLIFFIAGFETTASTLSYCIFELTRNPEVQERLYKEITRVIDSNTCDRSSEIYFDQVVHQISYLEAVIKETLRKYPPVVRLERRVGVDSYDLKGIHLYKDQVVQISALAVHYNPDYYADPERFDPERWMPENKHLLKPYTYIPFGLGPRNCVGMRFAYQEIKLALAQMITKFRFERSKGTPDQLQFVKGHPLLVVKDIPITVVKRE